MAGIDKKRLTHDRRIFKQETMLGIFKDLSNIDILRIVPKINTCMHMEWREKTNVIWLHIVQYFSKPVGEFSISNGM
jgi:hypothetical protein